MASACFLSLRILPRTDVGCALKLVVSAFPAALRTAALQLHTAFTTGGEERAKCFGEWDWVPVLYRKDARLLVVNFATTENR